MFNASNAFHVTVGVENVFTFEVKVDSNYTVSVEGVSDGGQLVDNGAGSYTFRWMVTVAPTSSVIFRAVDSIGANAVLIPVLHVCACFNGGECSSDGSIDSGNLIINMTCTCIEGEIILFIHVCMAALTTCNIRWRIMLRGQKWMLRN